MALKIRGSAFYFGSSADAPTASFDNYFAWMKEKGPDTHWPYVPSSEDPEIRRSLYCDLDATHFFGVFLSARNAEFQHYVRREGERVIIEARSTEGDPPVEMNFFCLRRDSNKGIFSHYLGSYRFQQFLHDLWMTYREFVKQQKELHLANLQEGESKTAVARTYSLHERRHDSPLYTPGTFNDLLNRLSIIREVRATSYAVDGRADQPVSRSLKSIHKVYRLEKADANNSLKQWIRRLRQNSTRHLQSGRTVHSGSVIGAEDGGADICVSFENTMEDYLEYDYDELGTFEINRIKQHAIVRAILEQMENGLLFEPTEVAE